MTGMRITVDAAMRARDVSRPSPVGELNDSANTTASAGARSADPANTTASAGARSADPAQPGASQRDSALPDLRRAESPPPQGRQQHGQQPDNREPDVREPDGQQPDRRQGQRPRPQAPGRPRPHRRARLRGGQPI